MGGKVATNRYFIFTQGSRDHLLFTSLGRYFEKLFRHSPVKLLMEPAEKVRPTDIDGGVKGQSFFHFPLNVNVAKKEGTLVQRQLVCFSHGRLTKVCQDKREWEEGGTFLL